MGCIFKPKGTKYFYIKYYRGGKAYVESTRETNKGEAKRRLVVREGSIAEGKFQGLKVLKIRVSDLLDLVIQKSEENNIKSLPMRKHYVELLKEFLGETKASNLTSSQITEYRKKRKAEGITDSTVNRELGALRRAFHLGMEHDPQLVSRIPKIPLTSEKSCVRKGFIEDDEFLALRGVLPDHLKVALTIGFYTGMRQAEILSLQWQQIDKSFTTLRLEVGSTKNKESRVVPIIPEMQEVLERWWMESRTKYPACPWVVHRDGKKITRHFGKSWATACKKVGLEGLLFHDLRRSAIRNLVRAGVPQSISMAISGHKTDSVFRRYAIVSEIDITEAGDKLSQYLHNRKKLQDEMVKKQLKMASEIESG